MLFAATSKDYRHNTGKRIAVNSTSRKRRRPGVGKGALVVAQAKVDLLSLVLLILDLADIQMVVNMK